MIWYNFSRIICKDTPELERGVDAEIIVWIMGPSGNPPEAVYLNIDAHREFRIPLLHAGNEQSLAGQDQTVRVANVRASLSPTSLYDGATTPWAEKLQSRPDIPRMLEDKCFFAGVVRGLAPQCMTATLRADNTSGFRENLGRISFVSSGSESFNKRVKRLCARVAQFIRRLLLGCARSIAKRFVRTNVQYFCIGNPERLGHLIANTDVFLSEKRVGLYPDTGKYEFFITENQGVQDVGVIKLGNRISNKAFYSLLQQRHRIKRLSPHMEDILVKMWHDHNCLITSRPHLHRDIHNALDQTPPIVQIPQEWVKRGEMLLEHAGLSQPLKVALIHARSADYTRSQYRDLTDLEARRYSYRNVDISSYGKAIQYLRNSGYAVVQLGSEAEVAHCEDAQVLRARSICPEDWFDLYLASICEIFVGNTSGAYTLADLFRRPIVFTNFAPLGHVYSWSKRHMTIFKKLHDKHHNSIVPASVQLNSELAWTIHMDKVDQDKYGYIDNTPDEILSVTCEMVERLEDKWKDSEEDVALQKRFWRQLPRGYLHKEINSRIGSEFLRSNTWLLE